MSELKPTTLFKKGGSVSGLAILGAVAMMSAPAIAQEAPEADTEQTSSLALETVTVTAQKREQEEQDVPIAISSFGGDFLERSQVTRVDNLAANVPALQISSAYGQTRPSFFMRGIGLDGFSAIDGNSVLVNQDDMVIETRAGSLSQLFDVERIEVLRGPQGTLFGRNATGGAISIFSRLPGDEYEGNLSATIGNFDRFELEGGVSIPLVEDKLAVRVAGQSVTSDGSVFNEFNGEKVEGENRWAGRAIFLYTPTDTQTWTLNLSASDSDNDGGTFFQIGALPDGSDFLGYTENPDPFTLSNDQPTFERTKTFRASLKGDIDLTPNLTLTTITGYNEVDGGVFEDSDASPANLLSARALDQTDQFSQELRLAGDNSGFNWVVGGFYFQENVFGDVDLFLNLPLLDPTAPGALEITQLFEQESTSYALFGQVDVPLGEIFTATAGLRWTNDERDFTQDVIIGAPAFTVGTDIEDDQLTWRAALTAEPTEDLLFYGSYSRGYRAGQPAGLAILSPAEFGVVDAEVVDTFEVGFKSEFANRSVQINGAAFYNDFENLQVVDFAPASDGSGLNSLFLRNAGATTFGAEVDAVFFPVPQWRIDASGAWLDSEYEDLQIADSLGTLVDVSGLPLVNAPEFSFNIATEYEFLTGNGSFIPRVEVVYTDDTLLKVSSEQDTFTQEAYTLVNLSAIYRPDNADWEIQLWGRNVAGEDYFTELVDVRDLGFIEARRGQDTTYGATLRVSF